MTGRIAVTIVLSLVAAFLYALSNVLEQHEAEQIADEYALRVGLLRRLAQRPLWLVGLVSDVGGYIVGASALALGAVIFVQPILSIGLLMSLLLSSVVHHKRLRRHTWYAAFVLCGGLALFLYEVSPTGGRDTVAAVHMLVWGPAIAGSIAACLLAARHAGRGVRAALLGAAASIAFSTSAVFTKAFVHYLGQGIVAWAPHWEPYALAVSAIFGLVVAQSAFQVGNLPAAVGGIEATQPVAAVILGVALLDERVASGSAVQVFMVVAAMIAIFAGIIGLANAEAEVSEPSDGSEPSIVLPTDEISLDESLPDRVSPHGPRDARTAR